MIRFAVLRAFNVVWSVFAAKRLELPLSLHFDESVALTWRTSFHCGTPSENGEAAGTLTTKYPLPSPLSNDREKIAYDQGGL